MGGGGAEVKQNGIGSGNLGGNGCGNWSVNENFSKNNGQLEVVGFNKPITGTGDASIFEPLTGCREHLRVTVNTDQQPLFTQPRHDL